MEEKLTEVPQRGEHDESQAVAGVEVSLEKPLTVTSQRCHLKVICSRKYFLHERRGEEREEKKTLYVASRVWACADDGR